jgi:hypothetical protein
LHGLQYRTSTQGWTAYTIDTELVLANTGDFVQFQNTNGNLSKSPLDYVNFQIVGYSVAAGNIMSLLNYSNTCPDYCFYNLFNSCTDLFTPPQLPATILGVECYQGMFR